MHENEVCVAPGGLVNGELNRIWTRARAGDWETPFRKEVPESPIDTQVTTSFHVINKIDVCKCFLISPELLRVGPAG